MNPLWNSLSSREGTTSVVLRQAVPASLQGELRGWIYYNSSLLPDEGTRLMIRLDLVVPDSYMQAYTRAMATHRQKLEERERKIEAAQAVREAARKEDGESSSSALMLYSLEPRFPYPPSPPIRG